MAWIEFDEMKEERVEHNKRDKKGDILRRWGQNLKLYMIFICSYLLRIKKKKMY
jgi:hypothetical protein